MRYLLILLFLVGVSAEYMIEVCRKDADCNDGCCVKYRHYKREFVSVARFNQLGLSVGTCYRYKHEGAQCATYEKQNGMCGCADGLKCRYHKFQKPKDLGYMMQKGQYVCAKMKSDD